MYTNCNQSVYIFLFMCYNKNMKIMSLFYRKAKKEDALQIASLITKLLGTCDVKDNYSQNCSRDEIFQKNLKHADNEINNYYVCSFENKIIGACGLSNVKSENEWGVKALPKYKEILYLVVDKNYQKKGIGTNLLKLCVSKNDYPIIYEAWGDKDIVNSKYLLEKCGFKLLKDLGNKYYKNNGYCPLCVNRDKNCNSCLAELYIKDKAK